MNISLTKSGNSQEYSVVLEEFYPPKGFDNFLNDLCSFLGEKFLYWHQGIMEGTGRITYKGNEFDLYWTDYPFALSFDFCRKDIAEALAKDLKNYFSHYS